MNAVQQILADLSDDEIRTAVNELRVLDETAVLPAGIIRNTARRLIEEVGVPSQNALTITKTECIRIAAYKWADLGREQEKPAETAVARPDRNI